MIISNHPFSIMLLLFALIITLIAEAFILPWIINFEKKKKDIISDENKSLTSPFSGLAGISFLPIMLFVVSLSALIASIGYNMEFFHGSYPIHIAALASGCLLIWVAGLIDNISGESYKKKKLIIQFLAAIIIVFGDLYINNFNGLFGIWAIPDWIGILFTIGLVMFITNAINLIDDADGLVSGISGVALIAFGYLYLQRGMFFYAMICTILVGILIPFFYYNVFNTTRKLFMGDTGSLTLGYLLAFLGVRYAMNTDANYEQLTSPVIISLSAMFIPLFDALRVMLERMCKGKSPFEPDRRHIHHKLLDLGFSHRKTMVWLVICAEIFVILNTNIVKLLNINVVFTIDMILWLGLIQMLNFLKRKKETKHF